MSKKIEKTEETLKLENEIQAYERETAVEKARAEAIVIETEEQNEQATAFIGELSGKVKAIETMRKFFVDPLNAQVKSINAMFKPQIEAREEVVGIVKGKMADFYKKKEFARLAEEKRLQGIRDKANEKRAEQGKEAIAEPVRQVEEVRRSTTVGSSQSTMKKVWKHKITSINALPDNVKKAIFEEAYKAGLIDTVIRKLVNAGIREMPGVEIYEDVQVAIRK